MNLGTRTRASLRTHSSGYGAAYYWFRYIPVSEMHFIGFIHIPYS